jgi:hypothetical protein
MNPIDPRPGILPRGRGGGAERGDLQPQAPRIPRFRHRGKYCAAGLVVGMV